MLNAVVIACLALSVISFFIFGYQLYLRRTQVTHQMKIAEDSLDLAKLIEAFARLADRLPRLAGVRVVRSAMVAG
jgi:hypothetical protein